MHRLGLGRTAANNSAGFTGSAQLEGVLFGIDLRPPGLKNHHHSCSSSLPGNHINQLYQA